MLYISLCELMKNWKKTLLMAFQIGLIMFLSVMAVTTYMKQTERYNYLKDFMHQGGAAVIFETPMVINDAGGIDKYMKRNVAVDEYHYVYFNNFSLDKEYKQKFKVYCYDELLSEYVPDIAEGVWYTEAEKKEGVLNVVITENPYGLKVGDTREMIIDGEWRKVYVCGKLADGAAFYTTDRYRYDQTVLDYYYSYEPARENSSYYMFTSVKQVDELGISGVPFGRILVSFKEGISDDLKEAGLNQLASSGNIVVDFKDLTERTESEINSKMVEIIPVIAGAFVLICLCIISISAIDTFSSVKSYAILYTCGMEWKSGMAVGAMKSAMTCVLSVPVMLMIYYITKLTGLEEKILFEFGGVQIFTCVIICIFMILLSCIMPSSILKSNQPADVLRKSKV